VGTQSGHPRLWVPTSPAPGTTGGPSWQNRAVPVPLPADEVAQSVQPFGRARMLPRAAYLDEAVLQWEREHLFDGGWVCAARGSDVAEPRSQLAVRIGTTGVVLVRDAQGTLRAFANICRHRGHELLACGARAVRNTLVCPYHAWAYDLDGAVRNVPHAGDMPNLVVDDLRLLPVAVAEWGGWVFVNVDGRAASFDEHLGGFAALTANWQCERLVVGATSTYELQANWKVPIENYHECYHCPLIHPELCRVTVPDSGDNVDDVPGAFVGGAMVLSAHASTMSFDGESPAVPLPGLDAAQRRRVLYVNIFPNLLIALHPDYVLTHRVVPVTARTSTIECQWLFDPETVAGDGFDPAYAVDFWDVVNRQDWAAVESVQRGIASSRFVPGVFVEREDAVYHFVTMVASAYLDRPVVRARAGRAESGSASV
jgi:Rieske 2Fe-2S family protein